MHPGSFVISVVNTQLFYHATPHRLVAERRFVVEQRFLEKPSQTTRWLEDKYLGYVI